jgi:hypothetical protein
MSNIPGVGEYKAKVNPLTKETIETLSFSEIWRFQEIKINKN